MLRRPTDGESMRADYASIGLSLRGHPLALLRRRFDSLGVSAKGLWELPDKSSVYVVGLVITRQRPGSANNVTFVTLEDETGFINLVVWESLANEQRKTLLNSSIMGVQGQTQKQDGVLHVIAQRLDDRGELLVDLQTSSRDFH